MPGLALTVATPWIVVTLSTAIPTSVSIAVRLRLPDGQNRSSWVPKLDKEARIRHSFDEGEAAMMLPSRGPGRRAVVRAVGAVALAGAMFVGSAAAASAEPPTPPPPAPPNCSPADWAGVRAGVAAATSAYLFTHPPVNDFFATLAGQSRDEMRPQVQAYLDANPQVRADLEGIKQPAVDFLNRCRFANPLDTA